MNKVELVIDMSEETYETIKAKACTRYTTFAECLLMNLVKNATVLPKGHGRLIDADALKKDDEVTQWLSLNAVRTGKMLKSFSELFIKKIDAADTILEADECKSESEVVRCQHTDEEIAKSFIEDVKAVEDRLPTTKETLKKGEWLRMSDLSEQEDDRYKCSRCGNVIHYKNKTDLYTFNSWCGRCGSDNGRHIIDDLIKLFESNAKTCKKCGSKDVIKEYISYPTNEVNAEVNKFYLCQRCAHIYDVNVEMWLNKKWQCVKVRDEK